MHTHTHTFAAAHTFFPNEQNAVPSQELNKLSHDMPSLCFGVPEVLYIGDAYSHLSLAVRL